MIVKSLKLRTVKYVSPESVREAVREAAPGFRRSRACSSVVEALGIGPRTGSSKCLLRRRNTPTYLAPCVKARNGINDGTCCVSVMMSVDNTLVDFYGCAECERPCTVVKELLERSGEKLEYNPKSKRV